MKNWWKRRSLKVRLALWYAAATTAVLTVFACFIYEVVEHRLAARFGPWPRWPHRRAASLPSR